ncbi:MAG: hypothetical protein BWY76_01027 [bacterium ADurb.Bin429]|nr:MAG: hypothetical protein BWY76_01027 [bacterium ADurb.Bin429]
MQIRRFPDNPIITQHMDERMGANINGPSLIRVPDWLPNPLGRYYLYFAHHHGQYIRLAVADRLEGPWRTYEPGVLPVEGSGWAHHIASPDAHVDEERREIRLYVHRPALGIEPDAFNGIQRSFVARSTDGLTFDFSPEILGAPYFRAFRWREHWYALGMPGIVYRSRDGLTAFEEGPTLFTTDMRHSALRLDGDRLTVYYSNAHDCPERILRGVIELTPDWMTWRASAPEVALEPETDWEGADLPLEPSKRGWAPERVRQLRDPAIYRENGRTYLLYAVAGESGIAIAEIIE